MYSLCVVDGGGFSVAGGWFDRHGLSPQKIGINGCTFGGHAIKTDLRRVLARHWIDQRPLQCSVTEGTVRLTGKLQLSRFAPEGKGQTFVAALHRAIGRVRGVENVEFDLANWTWNRGGAWISILKPDLSTRCAGVNG